MKNGVYAFDECSLLNMCEVGIPVAFQAIFGRNVLKHKNCQKLQDLLVRMDKEGIGKYRFVPSNINKNVMKVANELILDTGISVSFLPNTFKAKILEQLEEFLLFLTFNFKEIERNKDIGAIKSLFQSNLRSLRKKPDLPEDEDLEILAGYRDYPSTIQKYLISEDEHFWGYSSLILSHLGILVIPEWECEGV